LHIPMNNSMLNDISKLLRKAITSFRPSDSTEDFLIGNDINLKRLVGKEIVYVSTIVYQLINHKIAVDRLVCNLALQVTKQWTIRTDERGYLFFEPTSAYQVAKLKWLYSRSLRSDRMLLLQDSYSVSELSWWYVGDRCQQLNQQLGIDVREIDEILLGLVESEDDRVRFLLHGVVDIWDGLALKRMGRKTAIGRQWVERFLDWERAAPIAANGQTVVLLAILRLMAVEMLDWSTDR
jgi:hypothetical protein